MRQPDRYRHIYAHRAADYHRLIGPEDADGNLLPTLAQITPLRGKRILDLGTGTGRFPLLLQKLAGQLAGLDLHAAMLSEHQRRREEAGGTWALLQGDMRALPLPAAWADAVIAGWAIGHFTNWHAADWQNQVDRALAEMHRVAVPGGALIIIETLTTGSPSPAPPSKAHARYYAWLEREWGFARREIRTDYRFATVEEAVARTEFFFGPELAAEIRRRGRAAVPEWTGVWSAVKSI